MPFASIRNAVVVSASLEPSGWDRSHHPAPGIHQCPATARASCNSFGLVMNHSRLSAPMVSAVRRAVRSASTARAVTPVLAALVMPASRCHQCEELPIDSNTAGTAQFVAEHADARRRSRFRQLVLRSRETQRPFASPSLRWQSPAADRLCRKLAHRFGNRRGRQHDNPRAQWHTAENHSSYRSSRMH